MESVISKLAQHLSNRTTGLFSRIRSDLSRELKPHSSRRRMRCNIVSPEVFGCSGPKYCWLLVAFQKSRGRLYSNAEISRYGVVFFVAVFHEESMPLHIERHIIAHFPVIGVVGGHSSLKRMVDGVRLHVRSFHVPSLVRVCAIPAEVKRLSATTQFHIFHSVDATHHRHCMDSE